jgi:hypothetical protein
LTALQSSRQLADAPLNTDGRRFGARTTVGAGENTRLASGQTRARVSGMSTVSEIETAIEKLPPRKMEELAARLDEFRQTTRASDAVFPLYDEEENRPN